MRKKEIRNERQKKKKNEEESRKYKDCERKKKKTKKVESMAEVISLITEIWGVKM